MECEYDLINYLKGDLAPAESETISKHLDQCVDCQKEITQIRRVLGALNTIEAVEPSPGFQRRVMESVEDILVPTPQKHSPIRQVIGQLTAPFYFLRGLSTYLRYAPTWAASVVIHIILFGIMAFILVGPTQRH